MSALETLEQASEALQVKLTKARAEHDSAQGERDERNQQRRELFWTDAVSVHAGNTDRVQLTLAAFTAAVHAADGPGTVQAYLDYARAYDECAAYSTAAANATRRTVGVGVAERTVADVEPVGSRCLTFPEMLERAVKSASWGSAHLEHVLQPLRDELEG